MTEEGQDVILLLVAGIVKCMEMYWVSATSKKALACSALSSVFLGECVCAVLLAQLGRFSALVGG